MNILLVARWPVGGIKTYFRYVYTLPCFEGTNFTLIAPDINLSPYLEATGLKERIAFMPVKNSQKSLAKAVRTALKSNRFDIMHTHGFSAGVQGELARWGNSSGKVHLMTSHDMFQSKQFRGWRGWWKKKAIGALLGRIDHIHTATEDARQNMLEFFPCLDRERIHTILHGVNTADYADATGDDLKERLGIEHTRPLIGFFGRFMAPKGFRDLVDAVRIYLDQGSSYYVPMVVTFGWGGFIREDYQYLEKKGLSDYFVQCPHADDMPSMLKSVDMVVMPSLWEACGLLAMETLAAGTPLIASNCIGLREVLRDTPARVVPPRNPAALAAAIDDFTRSSHRETFKDFAPEARTRFSVERPAKALHELYLKLGKNAGRTS
jgi:glycosyltransferase involved in cell wall biosynthesis